MRLENLSRPMAPVSRGAETVNAAPASNPFMSGNSELVSSTVSARQPEQLRPYLGRYDPALWPPQGRPSPPLFAQPPTIPSTSILLLHSFAPDDVDETRERAVWCGTRSFLISCVFAWPSAVRNVAVHAASDAESDVLLLADDEAALLPEQRAGVADN